MLCHSWSACQSNPSTVWCWCKLPCLCDSEMQHSHAYYPKKLVSSVFIYYTQQLLVALAAAYWCSLGCFPFLATLRFYITNQQWVEQADLRGLLRIFWAPDGVTFSGNTQSWSFNSANRNRGPTFISSFYIPTLMSLDIFTAPLCWWADHWAQILCRLMCLLTEQWALLFSTSCCFNTLFDNFFPHYVPVKGTVLHLFCFCPECLFPFIYNVISIRGNSLLQDHVIGLEPLAPVRPQSVTIKAHECITLELSWWENPLPRELEEANIQDV